MRFAVIGTNFISHEFVRAGRTLDGFKLSAVYSRRRETAGAFAAPYGGARCMSDLSELAACGEVDAVYIASPNAFHVEQAERMLQSGKHVLLEKPAAPDARAFARLCAVAGENGVTLLEGMRTAFTPGFAAVRGALDRLGTVRRVSLTYCQYSSRYDQFKRGVVENAFDPSLCNGALMDIGVYCVHALIALFGRPARVQAAAIRLPNGLDAEGGALCVYDGMLADLSFGKIADGRRQSEIQGEAGTLLIDAPINPKHVVLIGRDGTRETVFHDADPEFFGMRHEIAAFMRLSLHRERFKAERACYNAWTRESLRLMDEMRRQTGIDFVRREADMGEGKL